MNNKKEKRENDGIICPSCSYENLLGTLFCVECGTYLPSGGPLRTEPLPGKDGAEHSRPGARLNDGSQQEALSIELEILKSHRKVTLPAEAEILFGRLDAAHGVFPEVDLTAEGGLENGVSRRHARIYAQQGLFHLEDLDSTNGTFHNEERLTPYVPSELHDGDILVLGTMRIKIRIYSAA